MLLENNYHVYAFVPYIQNINKITSTREIVVKIEIVRTVLVLTGKVN